MKIILPCRCGSFSIQHQTTEIETSAHTLVSDIAKLRFEGKQNLRISRFGELLTVEEAFRILNITTEN